MVALVTGSSGHLGRALVQELSAAGQAVRGIDLAPSPQTSARGSIAEEAFVAEAMAGAQIVFHTATLHKPHVATHSLKDFIETNITGTRVLLEAAAAAGVGAFVFTSTTSLYGHALNPAPGEPAAWVNESLPPVPKNIYGVTKLAAEGLCRLVHERHGLPCVILRTSRFFLEADDDPRVREKLSDRNAKANEFLIRRVDMADLVEAHRLAAERASALGLETLVVSATTPFLPGDAQALRLRAPEVLAERVPGFAEIYRRVGWILPNDISRVYDNARARSRLGWRPIHDFRHVLDCLERDEDFFSPLARRIGAQGYHEESFEGLEGPYPV